MKTAEEIREYLKAKTFDNKDTQSLIIFLKEIFSNKNFNIIQEEKIATANSTFFKFDYWFHTDKEKVLANEFYIHEGCTFCYIIFVNAINNIIGRYYNSYCYQPNFNIFRENTIGENLYLRIATPEEKQLLIDKVKENTGKIYNEQTKSFE